MGKGAETEVQYVDPFFGTGLRELYADLSSFLRPQIGKGITPYPGTTVPPVSPLQQAGFAGAAGLTPMATQAMGYGATGLAGADPLAGQRYLGTAEKRLDPFYQPFDPSMAMEAMKPAKEFGLQTYKQDVVPWIMEKYGPQMGAKESGAMWQQLGREGARLSSGLGAQLGSYIYPAWQSHLGRQQAGIGQTIGMAGLPGTIAGQAGQIGGMGADLLGQTVNIGGIQREIAREPLTEAYGKWQMAQPWASPWLGMIPSAGQVPQYGAITEQQSPGLASMFAPFLGSYLGSGGLGQIGGALGSLGGLFGGGGAATAGSIAGATALGQAGMVAPAAVTPTAIAQALMMAPFSDIRLKENINRIENALEKLMKLDGKTYNFKNDTNRQAGVIAQDVEKVLPEAVIEHKDIKHVDLHGVVALLVNAMKELVDNLGYNKARMVNVTGE